MTKFDHDAFLKTVTTEPGVYRMFNDVDEIIYIGKAKNLKKRLSSYFSLTQKHPKTLALVSHIVGIEVTITHTETEALIFGATASAALRAADRACLWDANVRL